VQSHKLRGPLSTIMGIVSFLMQKDIDQKYHEQMLLSLKDKAEEMDNVIREIVSRSE